MVLGLPFFAAESFPLFFSKLPPGVFYLIYPGWGSWEIISFLTKGGAIYFWGGLGKNIERFGATLFGEVFPGGGKIKSSCGGAHSSLTFSHFFFFSRNRLVCQILGKVINGGKNA